MRDSTPLTFQDGVVGSSAKFREAWEGAASAEEYEPDSVGRRVGNLADFTSQSYRDTS